MYMYMYMHMYMYILNSCFELLADSIHHRSDFGLPRRPAAWRSSLSESRIQLSMVASAQPVSYGTCY